MRRSIAGLAARACLHAEYVTTFTSSSIISVMNEAVPTTPEHSGMRSPGVMSKRSRFERQCKRSVVSMCAKEPSQHRLSPRTWIEL